MCHTPEAHLLARGFEDLAVLKNLAAVLVDDGVRQAVDVLQRLNVCAAGEQQRLMDAACHRQTPKVHLGPLTKICSCMDSL